MLDREKIAERRNREIASAVEYASCDSIRALIMAGYSSHRIQSAIEAGAIIRQADGRIILPAKESSAASKQSAQAQVKSDRPHIHYRGISRRTGFRIFTGPANLIFKAKEMAANKLFTARCRANGSNGNFLLTIEGRLPWLDPPPEFEPEEEKPIPVEQPLEEAILNY